MNSMLLRITAAFGLGTAAGLNATMPLFIVSLLVHFHLLTLAPPFQDALGSNTAMWGLLVLTLVELAMDKIPFLDSVGHVLMFPISLAAGAILFAAQAGAVTSADPGLTIVIGLLVGATTAGVTHTVRATVRKLALPLKILPFVGALLSCTEDIMAGILTGAALFAPALVPFIWLAMGIALILLLWLIFRMSRHIYNRVRQTVKRLLKLLGVSRSATKHSSANITSTHSNDLTRFLDDFLNAPSAQNQSGIAPKTIKMRRSHTAQKGQQNSTPSSPSASSLDFLDF